MAAPQYTRAHVDNCAFPAWYPALQHVSIKSEIIPLPDAFVSLLLADGVQLKSMRDNKKIQELRDHDDHDGDGTRAAKKADANDVEKHVREQVETALKKLKGSCFPKLNWSCPRDASWMLGGMKCVTYDDVFLLLKASDFIVHDLTLAYAGCCDTATHEQLPSQSPNAPPTVSLVLKKWCNFYDSMHFRCFVVNHSLVGVSQRHCDEFYAFLVAQQDTLCELLYRFFHDHVKRAFHCDRDFIFDVYVDKHRRVFLVDINVFGAVTDPLLFTWGELLELRDHGRRRRALRGNKDEDEDEDESESEEELEQAVDFRIVESPTGIRANPLSSYRTPTDFVDHLAATGGFDAFIDQVRRDNADASDDDDDDGDDQEDDDDDEDDVRWGSDNDDYDD